MEIDTDNNLPRPLRAVLSALIINQRQRIQAAVVKLTGVGRNLASLGFTGIIREEDKKDEDELEEGEEDGPNVNPPQGANHPVEDSKMDVVGPNTQPRPAPPGDLLHVPPIQIQPVADTAMTLRNALGIPIRAGNAPGNRQGNQQGNAPGNRPDNPPEEKQRLDDLTKQLGREYEQLDVFMRLSENRANVLHAGSVIAELVWGHSDVEISEEKNRALVEECRRDITMLLDQAIANPRLNFNVLLFYNQWYRAEKGRVNQNVAVVDWIVSVRQELLNVLSTSLKIIPIQVNRTWRTLADYIQSHPFAPAATAESIEKFSMSGLFIRWMFERTPGDLNAPGPRPAAAIAERIDVRGPFSRQVDAKHQVEWDAPVAMKNLCRELRFRPRRLMLMEETLWTREAAMYINSVLGLLSTGDQDLHSYVDVYKLIHAIEATRFHEGSSYTDLLRFWHLACLCKFVRCCKGLVPAVLVEDVDYSSGSFAVFLRDLVYVLFFNF